MKSRQDGPVRNKAVYLALGINLQGEKELLGMWIAETEGAKFWLSVFNELKSRGHLYPPLSSVKLLHPD